jgi:hypothetical protein
MTRESHQGLCWAAQNYLDLWFHTSKMITVAPHHVLQLDRNTHYLISNK